MGKRSGSGKVSKQAALLTEDTARALQHELERILGWAFVVELLRIRSPKGVEGPYLRVAVADTKRCVMTVFRETTAGSVVVEARRRAGR